MPVIRSRPPILPPGKSREELVDQLVRELRGEATEEPRPVIYEVPIRGGESYHVIVVWDRWGDISPEDRSSIVLDAYEQFEGGVGGDDLIGSKITIAVGTTGEDAAGSGLLPFRIQWFSNPATADPEAVRRAVIDEGAITTSNGLELRFPTEEMARAALDRLEKVASFCFFLEDTQRPRRAF